MTMSALQTLRDRAHQLVQPTANAFVEVDSMGQKWRTDGKYSDNRAARRMFTIAPPPFFRLCLQIA